MSIGSAGERLICLVSQPRAGSTLLQNLLGRHPSVHSSSEGWLALHPCSALKPDLVWTAYDHALARRATTDLLNTLPERDAAYWEGVRGLLGHLYNRALAESGRTRLLDKTPRYYFILPELRRVFPRARFVVLLRHPLAVLASLLETWVRDADAEGIAGHWHDLLSAPRLLAEALALEPAGTVVVRYEELLRRPAEVLSDLGARLDLEPFDWLPADDELPPPPSTAFGDQGLARVTSRPLPHRASRWPDVLRSHPVWHALGLVYLERLGPQRLAAFGYDYDDAVQGLGPDRDAEARATAERLLREPPSPDLMERLATAANARADDLERTAGERLAIIEEQRRAIAAFEAALADRDAERHRLLAERDERVGGRKTVSAQLAESTIWRVLRRVLGGRL